MKKPWPVHFQHAGEWTEQEMRRWYVQWVKVYEAQPEAIRETMIHSYVGVLIALKYNFYEIAHKSKRSIEWVERLNRDLANGKAIRDMDARRLVTKPVTEDPLYSLPVQQFIQRRMESDPPEGGKWTAKKLSEIVHYKRTEESDLKSLSEKQAWKLMRATLTGTTASGALASRKKAFLAKAIDAFFQLYDAEGNAIKFKE